jgi:hypothetical protein
MASTLFGLAIVQSMTVSARPAGTGIVRPRAEDAYGAESTWRQAAGSCKDKAERPNDKV